MYAHVSTYGRFTSKSVHIEVRSPPTLCDQLCGTPKSHLLTNIAAVHSMSGPGAASHRTIDLVYKE